MKLDDLQTFLMVARRGSFAAAATDLGVPKSTVSRRVARLEDDLGVTLVTRSRSATVTDEGRVIAERLGPALREIENVEQMVHDTGERPSGVLRVTIGSPEARSRHFLRLLLRYTEAYPDVRVEVNNTGRSIDLIEEGYDVAFRPGGPQGVGGPGLMRRVLGTAEAHFYASPAYLEAYPAPERFEDLGQADVIGHRTIFQHAAHLARHIPAAAVLADVEPRILIDDFHAILDLLRAGGGIGMAPSHYAAPFVRQGELVQVWPQPLMTTYVYLLWPETRHLSPRVRRFLDMAVEELAEDGRLLWE